MCYEIRIKLYIIRATGKYTLKVRKIIKLKVVTKKQTAPSGPRSRRYAIIALN